MNGQTRTRQILIIALAALILIALGYFLYQLFAPTEPTPPGREPSSFLGRLPIIGQRFGPSVSPEEQVSPPAEGPPEETGPARQLIQITEEPVIGPALAEDGEKILYYRLRDGHLMSNSLVGGAEETISNLTILNILRVSWSPDGSKAVIGYQDEDEVKKFITEAAPTPQVTFLPAEAGFPAWSPNGQRIFWLQEQNQLHTLISANSGGQGQRRHSFTTPMPEMKPMVMTSGLIGFLPKTASFFETPLFLFNLNTAAQSIPMAKFGLLAKEDADPGTRMIVYSSTDRTGALDALRTLDLGTSKETAWPVRTLAEKCAFSPDATLLFCAVPRALPAKDLPEAWFQGKISLADAFIKIDLAAGEAETIFDRGDYDAVNPVVSENAARLFFIDKKTGFLYSLSLE